MRLGCVGGIPWGQGPRFWHKVQGDEVDSLWKKNCDGVGVESPILPATLLCGHRQKIQIEIDIWFCWNP